MSWKRFDELLVGTVEIVSALLLIFITVLTVAQVIMRYIFNNPFTWSEELAIAAFIYLTFLGISVAYARDRHLWSMPLWRCSPERWRIVLMVSFWRFQQVFSFLVSILMIKVIVVTWKVGITTAALEIPRAFIYLSLPLGCVLFLIQVLKKLRRSAEDAMILLFGIMLLTLFMGMEIGTAMGFTGTIYILISWLGPAPIALTTVAQNFVAGVDSFPFLAIPMFVLAGGLMNEGGVTYHLVRFSQALVGHMTGGMGNVSVVANMIVSGMTGSSVADASATGSVMIPAMKQEKYPPEMASAIIAASASIGPIVPPSIALVIMGSMTGTSIGRLFLGWSSSGMSYGSCAPDNELHCVEAKRACSGEKIRRKRTASSR